MDRVTLVRCLVLLLATLLLVGWPGADVQTTDGDWRATGFDAQRVAQPELQRAATKGVVHLNTVARKISRLSARIKALAKG